MDHLIPGSEDWQKDAKQKQKKYKRWLASSAAKKSIKILPELDREIFEEVECLDCARCCQYISPRFKVPDIKRIAKSLSMKESVLIETYLRVDDDGDFVVQSSPCPFLGEAHQCAIYDVRPRDCRNYPYTDSDQFVKRPRTTLANSVICPAVYQALERLSNADF